MLPLQAAETGFFFMPKADMDWDMRSWFQAKNGNTKHKYDQLNALFVTK